MKRLQYIIVVSKGNYIINCDIKNNKPNPVITNEKEKALKFLHYSSAQRYADELELDTYIIDTI